MGRPIRAGENNDGTYSRRLGFGWKIKGTVSSDWYSSCSNFTASHRKWGKVRLQDGEKMFARDRLSFEAFWFHFGGHMDGFDPGDT